MGYYEDEYPLGSPEAIGVRAHINAYNTSHGTSFRYWDHDYNNIGVTDPDGNATGYNYDIPDGPHGDEGDTSPVGLHTLWTSTDATAVAARTRILASHEVIAFKSCFSEATIADEFELDTYKNYYLDMRNVFDAHPEKYFVVISFPPLHRNSPEYPDDIAVNTRTFANWLKSTDTGGFLAGNHPNIACFDLFDYLAAASTEASGIQNRLKQEYETTAFATGEINSHINSRAASIVGQAFGAFLINKALSY